LAVAILVSLAAVHVLGLIDDRKPVGMVAKLLVELLVAAILAGFFGVRIFQFMEQDRFGAVGVAACVILSTLWIVAITNAMNMLDNMDGLAGGVGAIITAMYLVATLIGQQWFVASMCAMLLGALAGFLVFNVPPAKLFMGDGGSLVMGLLLAVISVRTTYLAADAIGPPGLWYAVLMPLVLMAVPLYDLISVTVIRLRAGRSPLLADQNHLSHRLVHRGLSRRASVGVIWLTTLATGLGGVMLGRLANWQAALVAIQMLAVLTLLATLEMHTTPGGPPDD
jgi:UDP-GlcNAc:undecaprenyl-phosphate GlcNAc-1-phosphate transferase